MIYSKPQLFIIAGPNGAGKSTTSEKLLKPFKIKAFDWDKIFYAKWAEFEYDPTVEPGIRNATVVSNSYESSLRQATIFCV